jgi:hypothetical protein
MHGNATSLPLSAASVLVSTLLQRWITRMVLTLAHLGAEPSGVVTSKHSLFEICHQGSNCRPLSTIHDSLHRTPEYNRELRNHCRVRVSQEVTADARERYTGPLRTARRQPSSMACRQAHQRAWLPTARILQAGPLVQRRTRGGRRSDGLAVAYGSTAAELDGVPASAPTCLAADGAAPYMLVRRCNGSRAAAGARTAWPSRTARQQLSSMACRQWSVGAMARRRGQLNDWTARQLQQQLRNVALDPFL